MANAAAPAGGASAGAVGDAVLPADAHGDGAHAPVLAPQVIDVRNDFLVTSLMKDVIRRGTGAAAMALGRDDLAGKTGSTNDHRDAWFVGFNGDLSTAVWVGFDDFSSLGRGEFGAKAALPIWMTAQERRCSGKRKSGSIAGNCRDRARSMKRARIGTRG